MLILGTFAVIILSLRTGALLFIPFERRPWTADVIQFCFRQGLAAFFLFFDLVRLVRVTHEGEPAAPGPAVLVANHPSLIDALLLIPRLPKTACLYKAHLERVIFPRRLAENVGFISNAGGMESIRAAVDRLQKGWRVLAFPEGTRTTEQPMGPWKSSYALMAARAGAPIQPVYIHVDHPILAKGRPWWQPSRFPVNIRVRFGKVMPPPAERSVRRFHQELEASFRNELLRDCGPPLPRELAPT